MANLRTERNIKAMELKKQAMIQKYGEEGVINVDIEGTKKAMSGNTIIALPIRELNAAGQIVGRITRTNYMKTSNGRVLRNTVDATTSEKFADFDDVLDNAVNPTDKQARRKPTQVSVVRASATTPPAAARKAQMPAMPVIPDVDEVDSLGRAVDLPERTAEQVEPVMSIYEFARKVAGKA